MSTDIAASQPEPEEGIESQEVDLSSAINQTQSYRDDIKGKLSKVAAPKIDEWWVALIGEVTQDDFMFDGTALRSIEARIAQIDAQISSQLNKVMHHEEFQKLEGTWTGLKKFVTNTEVTAGELEIHVLNCSKEDLQKDFEEAGKPHLSYLYKKTVSDTYQVFGGVPFGVMIGDYEWTGHPADISTLTDFAKVASASHTSILTSPSPELFGFDSWEEMDGLNTNDIKDIFNSPEMMEWRSFRESDESRYVNMNMPRTMARLPYGNGKSNTPVKEFHLEELPLSEEGANLEVPNTSFCWSNSAYALGERITESFFQYGWTTSIQGVEAGGGVKGLPMYKYESPNGDTRVQCPTEVVLNQEQEFALSRQGFSSLQYYLETDGAVFQGGQTAHQPRNVAEADAQDSENLSARLPYILAVSRVSHFLKAIAHDKVGAFLERTDAEQWLNSWIKEYVDSSENPSDKIKRLKPFKKAQITVKDKPGDPGFFEVELQLAPWIKFEGMTTDVTLVSDIEK